jgi:hypothetical protein
MLPGMGHMHKKSMMDPKNFRPSLEIQLPDTEQIFHMRVGDKSSIPGSASKTAAFMPSTVLPNKGGLSGRNNYNTANGVSTLGKPVNVIGVQKANNGKEIGV